MIAHRLRALFPVLACATSISCSYFGNRPSLDIVDESHWMEINEASQSDEYVLYSDDDTLRVVHTDYGRLLSVGPPYLPIIPAASRSRVKDTTWLAAVPHVDTGQGPEGAGAGPAIRRRRYLGAQANLVVASGRVPCLQGIVLHRHLSWPDRRLQADRGAFETTCSRFATGRGGSSRAQGKQALLSEAPARELKEYPVESR